MKLRETIDYTNAVKRYSEGDKVNILIACEESQAVCKAFLEKGHNVFSCDLEPCSGGRPDRHIQGDVIPLLDGECTFKTVDGATHTIQGKWDMLIAFPPCTYMSNAGACRLYPQKGILNQERYEKGLKGKEFFMQFYNANCEKICVENPVPSTVFNLPKYTQTIQPYQHGHPYSKKTCLWLNGLPSLHETQLITENIISWVSGGSKNHRGEPRKQSGTVIRDSKRRSKTFSGIAKAMAEQWG